MAIGGTSDSFHTGRSSDSGSRTSDTHSPDHEDYDTVQLGVGAANRDDVRGCVRDSAGHPVPGAPRDVFLPNGNWANYPRLGRLRLAERGAPLSDDTRPATAAPARPVHQERLRWTAVRVVNARYRSLMADIGPDGKCAARCGCLRPSLWAGAFSAAGPVRGDRSLLGSACVYGQVLKTRRNDGPEWDDFNDWICSVRWPPSLS